MMRAPNVVDDHAMPHSIFLDDVSKPDTEAIQAHLSLQSLRHYLPPWLGGNEVRTRPLTRMLKALDTATESYLGTSLLTAEVVVPFPVSDAYLDALRSACSSLSLQVPMSAQPPAGILAARACGIGGKCGMDTMEETFGEDPRDDPAQLILTVDYSRAALTALLVAEECGVFEHRRVLHNTSLGADALSGRFNSGRGDLAQALRHIISLPLEDGNGAGLKQINELVLLGESAGDPGLEVVLKEVLREQFDRLVTSVSDGRAKGVDPLFAASNGVAQDCWDRMNFQGDADEGHDAL